ncbi:ABC transporter, ATP-binding protein [Giardia muris]|uniref:ABC transporter, ATP-binding protein n=1 Tax=Giardia muris TaxID=5742 RepID=A0A4Z1SN25_GIAMU|nr:ABC transporter, ATP-binding protein [Giardia muris]|eukprot:TNJ27106.1 ABC transporter, ATP-binding protein [Giardia muris]
MAIRHSLKATALYEVFSLRRDLPGLAVLILAPAAVLLLLNWLLWYVLTSALVDAYPSLPWYLPLERLGTPSDGIQTHLFNYAPATPETDRIARRIAEGLLNQNRAMLNRREIRDPSGFYAWVSGQPQRIYTGFDSVEELARYISLPIFHSTNCSYRDFDKPVETLAELMQAYKALNCEGDIVLTPDMYERYSTSEEYVAAHPSSTFQPSVFSLFFMEDGLLLRYNSTYLPTLSPPLLQVLGKDFYSFAGSAFYLALQRALSSADTPLPHIELTSVPERMIPQVHDSQAGAFLTILAVIVLNITTATFSVRDRGRGHTTLRLLGVEEGCYWFVRWISTFIVAFLSAFLLVTAAFLGHILPIASVTYPFALFVALLIGAQAVGFGLFVSAVFGRNGLIAPLVALLLLGICFGIIITSVFRLTYNTASIFDTSLIPPWLTWVFSVTLPLFCLHHILDYMVILMNPDLRTNVISFDPALRQNLFPYLSCGTPCYGTFPTLTGDLVCIKQKPAALEGTIPPCTYQVPRVSIFCGILIAQTFIYGVLAMLVGYTKSEPMHRGVNVLRLMLPRCHQAKDHDDLAISCRNVTISYGWGRRRVLAVKNFTAEISRGCIVALLGTNGAGKTSIMSLLAGELRPAKGLEPIFVGGHDIRDDRSLLQARRFIGKCPQHNQNVFEQLSVLENLLIVATYRGFKGRQQLSPQIAYNGPEDNSPDVTPMTRWHFLEQEMGRLRLGTTALRKRAGELSGGMRRRLSLLNATLGLRSGVVFMDEVSTGLDPLTCLSLHEYIAETAREASNTIVLTTHNMNDVDALAEYIIFMRRGCCALQGTTGEVKRLAGGFNLSIYADSAASRAEFDKAVHQLLTAMEQLVGKKLPSPTINSNVMRVLALPSSVENALPQICTLITDKLKDLPVIHSFQLETVDLDDAFVAAAVEGGEDFATSTLTSLYPSNQRYIYPKSTLMPPQSKKAMEQLADRLLVPFEPQEASRCGTFLVALKRLILLERRNLKCGLFPMSVLYITLALIVVGICAILSVTLNSFMTATLTAAKAQREVGYLTDCMGCCTELYGDTIVERLISSGREDLANNATYVSQASLLACVTLRPEACVSDVSDSYYTSSACQSYLKLRKWDVSVPRSRRVGPGSLQPFVTNNEAPLYVVGLSPRTAEHIRARRSVYDRYTANTTSCRMFLATCANGCQMASQLNASYNIALCLELCQEVSQAAQTSAQPHNGACIDLDERPSLVLDRSVKRDSMVSTVLSTQKKQKSYSYVDFPNQSPHDVKLLIMEAFAQQLPLAYVDWDGDTLHVHGTVPDILGADSSYTTISAGVLLPDVYSQDPTDYQAVLGSLYPNVTDFLRLANVTLPPESWRSSVVHIAPRGFRRAYDYTSQLENLFSDRTQIEAVGPYTEVLALLTSELSDTSTRIVERPLVRVQAYPFLGTDGPKGLMGQLLGTVSFMLVPPVFMAPILLVPIVLLREKELHISVLLALHSVGRVFQASTAVVYYVGISIITACFSVALGVILQLQAFKNAPWYTILMLSGLSYSSATLGIGIAVLLRSAKMATFISSCFIILCFMISLFVVDLSPLCFIVTPLYFLVLLQKGALLSTMSQNPIDVLVGVLLVSAQLVIILNCVVTRFYERIPEAAPITRTIVSEVQEINYEAETISPFLEEVLRPVEHAEPKLVVSGITHDYGSSRVLSSVGLYVREGEVMGLIGLSGSGKTTLLNTLTGIVHPAQGEAVLYGRDGPIDLLHDSGSVHGSPLSLVPQEDILYPECTVLDHVRLFAPLHGYDYRGVYVSGLLTSLTLFPHRTKRIKELSGGMRRRTSLLLALLGCRHILCLDEFTTGLSVNLKRSIWHSVLSVINVLRLSVIITSHDMRELEFFCTRVSVLHQGSLVYAGNVAQMAGKKTVIPGCLVDIQCLQEDVSTTVAPFYNALAVASVTIHPLAGTKLGATVVLRLKLMLPNSEALVTLFRVLTAPTFHHLWCISFIRLEEKFLDVIASYEQTCAPSKTL